MGNVMNIETKDGDAETAREIVSELQKQMSFVDHSLTGLAKSIDSMQAACKMLLLHQEERPEDKDNDHDVCITDENDERNVSSSNLALDLLRCIEESVTDHKLIAVECVRKMLHFIASTLQTSEISTNENSVELSLDTYFNAKNPFDSKCMYYDEKVKALRLEVDNLKVIKKSLRSRIDILNGKEYDLMEENDILRQQLNDLDNKLQTVMEENRSISVNDKVNHTEEKERNGVGKNNNDLCVGKHTTTTTTTTTIVLKTNLTDNSSDLIGRKTPIEFNTDEKGIDENVMCAKGEKTFKDIHSSLSGVHEMIKLKQIVQVQVFRRFARSYIDWCLIDLVQKRAETQEVDLKVIRCSNRQDLNPDIPILVMCSYEEDSTMDFSTVVTGAMDGIEATLKVAAVVLHIGVKKPNASKSFAVLKDYHPHSSLGGIFDVVCDFHRSVLSCVENNDTVDGIIKFIYKRSS